MYKNDWVIYGNSLSALKLTERLGSENYNVTLINPGRSFGEAFGGVCINEQLFDCGMTNFEFELFAEPEDEIPNYGLCDFKEAIGCQILPKTILEKLL